MMSAAPARCPWSCGQSLARRQVALGQTSPRIACRLCVTWNGTHTRVRYTLGRARCKRHAVWHLKMRRRTKLVCISAFSKVSGFRLHGLKLFAELLQHNRTSRFELLKEFRTLSCILLRSHMRVRVSEVPHLYIEKPNLVLRLRS